jgi:hypothetical protein
MNRVFLSRLVFLVVLAGVGLVPGCSKEVPLAPVSGKVTVDGQPLNGGYVTFHPDLPNVGKEGAEEAGKKPTPGLIAGEIGPDGSYTIYTSGKKGAPLGKYKVTVAPSMVPDPETQQAPPLSFHKKYSDFLQTPLRVEVVANPKPGDYDLKLTSK